MAATGDVVRCDKARIQAAARVCAALFAAGLALAAAGQAVAATAPATPNIVLVILDDVGLTDLGATGGEARTPVIDALADEGVLFASFNTAPMCAPSRAMLLTGVSSHHAGIANLPETTPAALLGQYGYEGHLTRRAATLAEHLRPAGYQTFIAGKWHLGHGPDSRPDVRGFDRSFVLDASGADNWQSRPYLAYYDRAEWWSDGEPVDRPEGQFSSDFLVDRMLGYLGERDPGRPFLAVVGFQAVHIPVQAPPEIVERYDGIYDQGWTALLQQRHRNATELGLIPATATPPDFPPGLRDWAGLTAPERAFATAAMEVNSAMLDATDRALGRLVEALREAGVYDDTIFVVVSDNGPEHNRPDLHAGTEFWLRSVGYSTDPARLGGPGTYAWIGPEWAKAAAGHGGFFKMHAGSGGMNVPLIVTGPGIERRGLVHDFAYATDLVPTLLDLAGAEPVAADVPVSSHSLAPLLSAASPHTATGPESAVAMEAGGHAAVFLGSLKLVRNAAPYGDGEWRLYDWTADPGETADLSADRPEDVARLMTAWDAFVAEQNVLPVDPDYAPANLLARRTYAKRLRGAGFAQAGLLILLAGVAVVLRLSPRPPS